MNLKSCLLTIEDRIAVVTINREKALNALNQDVISDLGYLFEDHLPKQALIGVIITGAGDKSFVAGADITQFQSLDKEAGSALAAKGQRIFLSIENMNIPIVAAINGFALGGGCELAMACHMRIASENAMFGQPEVKLGLIPGYGGTQRLTRYVGKAKSMELILTGKMIDAQEAKSIGLINAVVPVGKALQEAIDMISKIGKMGPLAVSKSIAAINAYHNPTLDGFEAEVDSFGICLESEESTEGVTAFIEKRKPNF